LGIGQKERYAILRFVSRNALHDYGHEGISEEFKKTLVETITPFMRVFISSETELAEALKPHQFSISPWEMHDVIAGAAILIGESATMAAEAAMLGVPAIFIDNQGRGYTNELEKKYELIYNFKTDDVGIHKALNKSLELIQMNNCAEVFQNKQQKMLKEKIDLTAFLVWFIESYPESSRILKENPGYQNKFMS